MSEETAISEYLVKEMALIDRGAGCTVVSRYLLCSGMEEVEHS
jgi:hypothetical protein